MREQCRELLPDFWSSLFRRGPEAVEGRPPLLLERRTIKILRIDGTSLSLGTRLQKIGLEYQLDLGGG